MKALVKEVGGILLGGMFISLGLGYFVSYSVGTFMGSATLYLAGRRIYEHIIVSRIPKESEEE